MREDAKTFASAQLCNWIRKNEKKIDQHDVFYGFAVADSELLAGSEVFFAKDPDLRLPHNIVNLRAGSGSGFVLQLNLYYGEDVGKFYEKYSAKKILNPLQVFWNRLIA